ncbi:MAG: hypothetical protein AzoDbin1_02593 [Azoarcus sp.]|uniref:MetA-pathway of phenol degradation n=1 Tax=Aromatoleum tolulyticum TaxID=34027 RepID=A0A1N6NUF0_9RHOO|nr:hypothetical protein [Aromatoleum tolulyticum]MCK9986121.1 hypothetical protein [Azoarcus sp.]SIP95701.1 hypothetical protein SAMN05421829_101461 [Aromatoleum tolulyticum]
MKKQLIALALAGFGAGIAHAGPAAYIYTPTVEYGEHEIEFKAGSHRDHSKEDETAMMIGYGMGVTPWWFTELNVEYERERGERFKYEAFEWENKFQLLETGKYPIDLGVLVEIERPREHAEGWELKLGLLTQKDFGKVQANFNVLAERHYDAEEKSETELGYQWQLKYRLMPTFEYGLQGMGEVGKWNDWAKSDEQEHMAGPAIFGKLPMGGHQALKYDVGFLFGMTKDTPEHTLRMKLEYEF